MTEPKPEPRPKQTRKRRRSDWTIPLACVAAVICFGVFGFKTYSNSNDIKHNDSQRTDDLRASCRRGSARAASQANLNWVYYESEVRLQGPSKPSAPPANLPPGAAELLKFFATQGGPSLKVLKVRAQADYNAAFAQAQTVDFRDAGLIPVQTDLGKSATVRRWVLKRHYDCRVAFAK